MLKKIAAFIFGLMFTIHFANAERKIVFSLKADNQINEHGFNVVKEFSKFLYPLIQEGKIKIYTDANKSKRIDVNSFLALESQTEASFNQLNQILIYEMWESYTKITFRKVHGFSFLFESNKDEIINFGFIDYAEILSFLKNNEVKTNALGYSPLTWWQVFQHQVYDKEMITLDGSLTSPRQEKKVIDEYFKKSVYKPEAQVPTAKKRILIELTKSTDSVTNQLLYFSFHEFVKDNKSEFLAHISEKNRAIYFKKTFSIQSIRMIEEWSNSANGLTKTVLMFGILPEGSLEFDYISEPIITSWNILINDLNFTNSVKLNSALLRVLKINSQDIPSNQSNLYLQSLYYNWDNMNEYLQQNK